MLLANGDVLTGSPVQLEPDLGRQGITPRVRVQLEGMLPVSGTGVAVRTDRVTHCPYKGDASYFSIAAGGQTLENSIWTYETPFPAMREITGYLAFYPDKVTIEELPAG